MADKKITSGTGDYFLPKMSTHAASKDIVIKHNRSDKFDLYQKDFPANLPSGYTWINSFGLKARKKDPKNPNQTLDSSLTDLYANDPVDMYTIELDDIAGKEPVYFYNGMVHNFQSNKVSVGNNRVQVNLDLGDPPIGWP